MHPVVSFYLGKTPDNAGRMIEDIWAFASDQLEYQHDYIQWLFPNERPSPVNPEAPVLDEGAAAEFRGSVELQNRLRRSFEMMLRFYGFDFQREGGQLTFTRSPKFHERAENWLQPRDHNHLRITRILKCLMLCGLEPEARAFLDQLTELAPSYRRAISEETLAFWRGALQVPPQK